MDKSTWHVLFPYWWLSGKFRQKLLYKNEYKKMGEKKKKRSFIASYIQHFLSPESWSIGDVLIKVKVHSVLYSLAGLRPPTRQELPCICIVKHTRRFGSFQQGTLVVVHGLLWLCNLPSSSSACQSVICAVLNKYWTNTKLGNC